MVKEEIEHKKKRVLYCFIAILIALLAFSLAQSAQDTADINNVFEIVVNNTDMGSMGTTERINGVKYWANDSPLQIEIITHTVNTGVDINFNFSINDTIVWEYTKRSAIADEHHSMIQIVPKGANYTFKNSTAIHHYEWREYPILSGKNGTLSLNVTGNYVNKTGDTMTGMLNASATINTTYINITHDARARKFRTGFSAYITTDTLGSNELDFFTGGTHNMKITTSGRLYAYGLTNSAQSSALCYNSATNEITYNSAITSCVASNESLKTNITNITGTITPFVLQLQPIKYRLASENADIYHVGLSAQSVEKVLNGTPYEKTMIGHNPDGTISGLRYEELTPFLIKVIQEQQKTINKICSKNQTLCE